jgi:hypothetical protein
MDKKEILEKVLKDVPKGFRKKFLNNPKKALEEITGQKLGDWKVEIHRLPKKTIVFSLPEELPSPEKVDKKMLSEIAAGGLNFAGKVSGHYVPDTFCDPSKPCLK